MRLIILILIFIKTTNAFSQIESILINKETKDAIPYASIYIKNEQKGTSSDYDGRFTIDVDNSNTLIISSIGYKRLELAFSELTDTIFLAPDIMEMKAVEVQNKKKLGLFPKRNRLGNVSKSFFKNQTWYSTAGYPYEIARFFEYKKEFSDTRFIESVTVETSSDVKDAIFSVKFYKVGDDGFPGEIINKSTIIGTAKRGRHKTKIKLIDDVIFFPAEGLFIAVEFLIIAQNRIKRENPISFEGNTYNFKYEPSFSVIDCENDNFYRLDIKNQKWNNYNANRKALECEILLTE